MVNVRIFIFYNITMAMAEACLKGIGKYPPYPSRLPMPPSSVGFASGRREGIGNLSGCGGYFPIPPRHNCAIVPVETRYTIQVIRKARMLLR